MAELTKAWRDGGRRTCSPQETWARLKPLLPVFGIARVANITGLDRIGIPVFTACRPNSRSLSVFQGKGLSTDAARVSAVMEAYETWCAESIDAPLKFASIDELQFSHPLIDVTRLPLATVEGVDPSLPFLWIEGADLMDGSSKWLPFEMVHANYATPEPPHSQAFAATTNGLASGNTVEEARLHALMEVIERDAISLWKLGPDAWGSTTAVRLDTVTGTPRLLLDLFEAAGIDIAIWDVTSDIGIPTFIALIHDRTGETGADELGGGTHVSAEVALVRALTEAAQARGTFIAGAREDITDPDYTDQAIAERREMTSGLMQGLTPERDFSTIRSVETDSFEGDINAVLTALRRIGIDEAVAVDIGRAALPFAVSRVVVPGLEAALEGPQSAYVPGARAARVLETAEVSDGR
ncbi:MAG: YcaO-like family protein [Pseudomonadota bacterium]